MTRVNDIRCPLCGRVLAWACLDERGWAYCEAWQSQRFNVRDPASEPCVFRGPVRRVSPNEVKLVTE